MKLNKSLLLAGAAVVALSAGAKEHLKSLDAKSIDPATPASVDFYRHVNKGWMDEHQLTPAYARYGQFNILNDSSNNRVRRIVANLAKTNPEKGTNAYKIAAIYELAMDSVRRNQLGATPIAADLKKIDTTTPAEMENLLLWLHKSYASPLFSAGPQEDMKNSNEYAMYLGSGGMTLGDRDYYLKNDKRNKEVRDAYTKLIQALKKLNAITVKIGYPDKWKDYSTLEIDPNLSYWENIHNAMLWHNNEYLKKWGKPADRTEWGMTPQTINAYYNPLYNEIVFPAGILQAPFFDPNASDAENYGGIGVVIGHELTHGFDDQGCNFDADGNMINWWAPEDAEAFQKMTQGLVAQFDEVEVLPGLHANGQYTLGENIADQGGLRVAMTGFLDSQKKKGVDVTSEEALIDGFDPIQVYYMNYANLWAQNVRDEEMRSLTSGDVHSLGENRVNVSLRNIEPFFKAFNIKEGDKMYRPAAERIIIW